MKTKRREVLAGAAFAQLLGWNSAGAQENRTIEFRQPGSGRRIRVLAGEMEWRVKPGETGDSYFMLESFVRPGHGVPPHRHPEQEGFLVLDGEVEFGSVKVTEPDWATARAGDFVQIPGNVWHTWRNGSKKDARVLVMGPARLGRFFEEAGVPVEAGSMPQGPPSANDLKRVGEIMTKFGHEFKP